MKSLRYILLTSLFCVLLFSIGFRVIDMTPNEVDYFNRYFVTKTYDDFSYTPSIDAQLTSTAYDKNTLIALHHLVSARYDFGWAKKEILSLSDYSSYLNKTEVLHALAYIKDEIIIKSYIIGFLIFYVKWFIIISIFEFIRQFSIKLSKKRFKVEAYETKI